MKTLNNKPLRFSNRDLLNMLIPLIVTDLTAMFVHVIDSIMVSSTGEAAVSGISLVGTLQALPVTFFSTLGVGCAVVISQQIGAGNFEKARNASRHSLLFSIGISLPVFALLMIFGPALLQLVYPDADPTAIENAKVYFLLVIPSLPAIAAREMMLGMIRAMGNNKLIFLLSLFSNIANIIGNAILIYGFNMGVAGAAIATTASTYLCTIICFVFSRKKNMQVNIRGIRHTKFNFAEVRNVLSVSLSTCLERTLMTAGRLLVTAMYSNLSTVAISAYSVSQNLCSICWSVFYSFGSVLMTVVGQCIGADEPEQAKHYTKKSLCIAIPLCFLMNGILFLLRNELVQIYDLSGETLVLAAQYTAMGAALTAFCLFPLAILPAYSFRAAGDTLYVSISSTMIAFICQVGLCFLFVKHFNWGIPGVRLSVGIDWLFRVVIYSIHFHRNKWLTKKVV